MKSAASLVIVGSGIAGLSCALEAAAQGAGPVVLLTKQRLENSNTYEAQGGIAGVMSHGDSPALHTLDTLRAGAGRCDARAVRRLCYESHDALHWLIDQGVPFDRAGDSWAYGLEGAHSMPRIMYAHGDGTGRAIVTALIQRLKNSAVHIIEEAMLIDLTVTSGRVTGVEYLWRRRRHRLCAAHVVLATGGAGHVYARTSNPDVATGDGVACAFRAGAVISDAEFVQFHPTVLAINTHPLLISEAVRGEGAVLRNAQGDRFMLDRHPLAELAPRDVVAREIMRTMALQEGAPVTLDATALGRAVDARFPGITAALSEQNLTLSRNLIPVAPAAHYWMGGIKTDTVGRSTLPGLYAIGEAACTGVHGANRLASNSLLEGVVFARRLVRHLCAPAFMRHDAAPHLSWMPAATVLTHCHNVLPNGDVPPCSREALQRLMWSAAGLEREAGALSAALGCLQQWRRRVEQKHDDIQLLTLRNLLDIAVLICTASLLNEHSQGAHYRKDGLPRKGLTPRPSALVMSHGKMCSVKKGHYDAALSV